MKTTSTLTPTAAMRLMSSPSGLQPIDKLLKGPYDYICEIPGKGFRGKLIDIFNIWLRVDEDKVAEIKRIVDKLHNASLLIDDIEDNSKLRRGVPVAHSVFGVPMTINSANFVYFEALQDTRKLGNIAALDAFLDEIMWLHRGQGMDIFWRDSSTCPSFDEYTQMVLDKTGGLFRLSMRLMQAFSEYKKDLTDVCNDLGLYYQVMDDYLNLQSEQYHLNKSFAEDLTEGKFSFPIIHAIKEGHDHNVFNILKQRTDDVDLKKLAIQRMTQCGSFDFTLKFLESVRSRLDKDISKHEGNVGLMALLDHWNEQLPLPLPVRTPSTCMSPFEPPTDPSSSSPSPSPATPKSIN